LLFVLFSVIGSIPTFLGVGFGPYCMPTLGGTPSNAYQNPQTLSAAWQLANTPDPCGYGWAGIDSPLVETIKNTQNILFFIALPYILSCVVITGIVKLKKKNKNTTATVKK
jgi:hypothetical protein